MTTGRFRQMRPRVALFTVLVCFSLIAPAVLLYLFWPVGIVALVTGSAIAGAVHTQTGVPSFITLIGEYLFLSLVMLAVSTCFVFYRSQRNPKG